MQFGDFVMRFASIFDPKGVDAAISATERIRNRLGSLQKAFETISGKPIVDEKSVKAAEANLEKISRSVAKLKKELLEASRGDDMAAWTKASQSYADGLARLAEARRQLAGAQAGAPPTVGATIGQYAGLVAGRSITQFAQSASSAFGGGVSLVGKFAQAILTIPNPLNLVANALRPISDLVRRAFDAAFLGAFIEVGRGLTNIFFGWLNALLPVQPLLSGIGKIVMSLTPMGALGEGGFAQIETQLKGLQMTAANTGVTAKDLNSALVAIRTTGIQAAEGIQAVSQGMQAGISTKDIQRLARGAQDLAQISGETSTDSFNRLFRSVTTANTEILRTVGIMKTQDQFINEFAMRTGRTYDEIRQSQTLLRQAFIEGILRETTKYAGAYDAAMETVSKRLNSLKRLINDFTTSASQAFTPLLSGVVGIIEKGLDTLTGVFLVTKKQSQENAASMIRDQFGIADAATLNAAAVAKLSKLAIQSQSGKEKDVQALDDYINALLGQAQAAGLAGEKLNQYGAYLRQMSADVRDGKESFEALGGAMQPTQFNLFMQALSRVAGRGLESFGLDFLKQFFNIDKAAKDFAEKAPERLVQAAERFAGAFARILERLMDFGASFVSGLSKLFDAPLQVLGDLGSRMVESLSAGIQGALSAVSGILTNLAVSLQNGFLSVIRFLAGQTKKEFEALYTNIGSPVSKADESLPIRVEPKIRIDANWGRNLRRDILDILQSEDFEQYNFLGGFVEKILGSEGAALEHVEKFRAQLLEALGQIRTTGTFDENLFGPILDMGGNDVLANVRPMLLEYLNLWKLQADEVRRQREEQKELEQQTFRLQAAQERLRQFERGTQDIPVRYTRARRDQLQAEIDAINRERELMEQRRKERQWDVQERQREFDQLKATLQEALRLAEKTGQIDLFKFKSEIPQIDTDQFTADFEAKVKDMANRLGQALSDAFKPARFALLEFLNFLGGIVGGEAFKPITLENIKAPQLGDYMKDDGSYDFQAYENAMNNYRKQQSAIDAQNLKINERFSQGVKLHGDLLVVIEKVKDVWVTIVGLIERAVLLVGAFAAGLTGGTLSRDTISDAKAGDKDAQQQVGAFRAGQGLAEFGKQLWDSLPEPVRKLLTDFRNDPINVTLRAVTTGFEKLTEIAELLFKTFSKDGKIDWGRVITLTVALVLAKGAFDVAGWAAGAFGGLIVQEGGKWVIKAAMSRLAGAAAGGAVQAGGSAALQTFASGLAVKGFFSGIATAFTSFITVTLPAWGASLLTALQGIIAGVLSAPVLVGAIIGFLTYLLLPEEWKTKFHAAFWAGVDAWKVIVTEQMPLISTAISVHIWAGVLKAKEAIEDWVTTAGGKITEFRDNAEKWLESIGKTISTKIEEAKKKAVGFVKDMVGDIKTAITNFPTNAAAALTSIKNAISDPFNKAKEAITTFVSKLGTLTGMRIDFTSIRSAFQSLTKVIEPIAKAAENVANVFKKIFDGILAKAGSMSAGTRALLTGFANTVTTIFGKLFDTLLGHSIIPDITDGITEEFGALTDRNKGGISRFANMIEGGMAGINASLAAPNAGGAGSLAGAADAVSKALQININQSGWIFPANMSPEQMDALRNLAREETYNGIIAAFEGSNA